MKQLIGKIQYPAKDAALEAAWCTLTAEAGATALRFALINRSEKTVNAYRVAISYTAAGEEHCETVAEKSLSLVAGATSAEHEIALPVGVEEGVLTVEAAIYDDLSHNDVPLAFPFATFEVVSRVADEILTRGGTKRGAAPIGSKRLAPIPGGKASPAPAKKDDTAESREDSGARLPLILAIGSCVALALWMGVLAIAEFCIGDGLSKFGIAAHMALVPFHVLPGILALLTLQKRTLNPRYRRAVTVIGYATLLFWIVCAAMLPYEEILNFPIFFTTVPAILSALVFGILALTRKDRVVLFSCSLVLIIALLGTVICFQSCASEQSKAGDILQGSEAWGISCNGGEDIVYFYGDRSMFYNVITMPDTCPEGHPITTLASECFAGVTCMELYLGSHVRTVGPGAFKNATVVSGIYHTENIVTIEDEAFYEARLDLNNQNGTLQLPSLRTMGACAFAGSTLYGIGLAGSTIETIPTRAFYNCPNLSLLHMGDSVKRIDLEAFSGCSALVEIQWSPVLEAIGDYAFDGCSTLHKVYFYFTLRTVGDGAFRNCNNLTELRYEGDEEQWQEARGSNAVQIGAGNEILDSCAFYPGFGN